MNNVTNVRIISDGTSWGTKVFVGDTEVQGLTSIVIDHIVINDIVTATITVSPVALDTWAKADIQQRKEDA